MHFAEHARQTGRTQRAVEEACRVAWEENASVTLVVAQMTQLDDMRKRIRDIAPIGNWPDRDTCRLGSQGGTIYLKAMCQHDKGKLHSGVRELDVIYDHFALETEYNHIFQLWSQFNAEEDPCPTSHKQWDAHTWETG